MNREEIDRYAELGVSICMEVGNIIESLPHIEKQEVLLAFEGAGQILKEKVDKILLVLSLDSDGRPFCIAIDSEGKASQRFNSHPDDTLEIQFKEVLRKAITA